MNVEQLKIAIGDLPIEERKSLIHFIKSTFPKKKAFSIRKTISKAKEMGNVPRLKIIAYRKEALKQAKFNKNKCEIDFEMALHLAIDNLLRDGRYIESPVAIVKENPEDFNLDRANLTDADVTKAVHNFMNDGQSTLELITEESRFPPEEGESIQDYWIFLYQSDNFSSALHWVLIDRTAEKTPFNYAHG